MNKDILYALEKSRHKGNKKEDDDAQDENGEMKDENVNKTNKDGSDLDEETGKKKNNDVEKAMEKKTKDSKRKMSAKQMSFKLNRNPEVP